MSTVMELDKMRLGSTGLAKPFNHHIEKLREEMNERKSKRIF